MRSKLLFIIVALLAPLISFGPLVDAELARLDYLFAIRVRAWLLLVRLEQGLSVVITSGRRSYAQQLLQHRADPRNPMPNEAKPDVHMRGVAVDVNFWRDGMPVLLKASADAAWQPIWDLAEECGISNGHAFNGYKDKNHFYRS
jgi:D-alanyl-D-alanine carboxypeptidase